MTAYTATFWTDAPSWSMSVPFALSLNYGMEFDTDDLVSRTIKEIKHVDPGFSNDAAKKLKPQLERVFPPVKKGDSITASYMPGHPVVFSHNGHKTGSIAGDDFAKDFFGVWLSPQTSDASLRQALLKLR